MLQSLPFASRAGVLPALPSTVSVNHPNPRFFVSPLDPYGLGKDGSDNAAESSGQEPHVKTLGIAAPDICYEEESFRPRSQAQENANIGADEGIPTLDDAPTGPWVEAAKQLLPPKPTPKVKRHTDF